MILSRPVFYSVFTSMCSVLALGLTPGCGGDDSPAQSTSSGAGSSSANSASSSGGSGGGAGGSSASSSSSAASGTGGGGGQQTGFHLSGKVSYESVPYNNALEGLDYAGIKKRPIRGASVRLLNADTSAEIAKTVSDDKGGYSFNYVDTASVKLWVSSETKVPSITVEDNTAGDAIYTMESAVVASGLDVKLNPVATTGWTGAGYTKARLAAPFAVLDAAYTAAHRFLTETTTPPQMPPLKLNWSVDNRPEDGDKSLGQIGTSQWDHTELYILGKESVDTDEFEGHIIVHEWTHFFQGKVGRSDSPGGSHNFTDVVDPRVAWGEGFATAISAIILDPDTVYADSYGLQQKDGFHYDLEVNDASAGENPGWYSERTVSGIVFDLYDGANEPFDKVNIGLNGIYTAMVADRTTPALTTIFSFTAGVKAATPQAVANINTLVAFYKLDVSFGLDTIQDAWGTGETHTGGVASSVPVYRTATIGSLWKAKFTGGASENKLTQNRYFRIAGDGQPITVESTCASDVDLFVYKLGTSVAEAKSQSGDEMLTFATTVGQTYVLVVQGFETKAIAYSADITFTH